MTALTILKWSPSKRIIYSTILSFSKKLMFGFCVIIWSEWHPLNRSVLDPACMNDLMAQNSALCFPALLAIHYWMEQKHGRFIWLSAFAIMVFRAELCLLLGFLLLADLIYHRLSIQRLFIYALPAGIFCLGKFRFGK